MILVLCAGTASADIKERPAPNGISPGGKYEVVEVESLDEDGLGSGGYDVELRPRGQKVALGKCECGYGTLKVDEDFTVILWSADSHFVAIKTRDTKRTFSTTLFFLDGKNTKEFKPAIDYFQNICGRLGTLGNDFRNTIETPVKFVPGNGDVDDLTLKVEVPSLKDDIELSFEVTISCFPPFSNWNGGNPEPHAEVVSITGPVPDPPENR